MSKYLDNRSIKRKSENYEKQSWWGESTELSGRRGTGWGGCPRAGVAQDEGTEERFEEKSGIGAESGGKNGYKRVNKSNASLRMACRLENVWEAPWLKKLQQAKWCKERGKSDLTTKGPNHEDNGELGTTSRWWKQLEEKSGGREGGCRRPCKIGTKNKENRGKKSCTTRGFC